MGTIRTEAKRLRHTRLHTPEHTHAHMACEPELSDFSFISMRIFLLNHIFLSIDDQYLTVESDIVRMSKS